ncbi:hypothetical protein NUSPORA_00290 [Nucleospora cyclopteri]
MSKIKSSKSYYKVKRLGEGTYATIYLAKEAVEETEGKKLVKIDPGENFNRMVAIKKIKKTEYGCGQEVNAIREIKSLKSVKHDFVLEMLDIFIHKNSLHLVLEYIDFNLEEIIKCKNIVIMPSDIKSWMFMLLSGLKAFHDNFYIHRDLKPNNLLIRKDGTLKIADFGLTRKISDQMTPNAVTRWYRAPEMLLGERQYTSLSDMWSVGLIFAELFLRVPLFAADTDIQQLDLICKALGTPRDSELFSKNASMLNIKYYPPTNLHQLFTAASEEAYDLLVALLQFDPLKRIDVYDALNHKYFRTKPYATKIGALPVINRE